MFNSKSLGKNCEENSEENNVVNITKNSFNAYDFLRDTYESSDGFSSDSEDSLKECFFGKKDSFETYDSEIPKVFENSEENYFNVESSGLKSEEKTHESKTKHNFLKTEVPNDPSGLKVSPFETPRDPKDFKQKIKDFRDFSLKTTGSKKSQSYCCIYCQNRNEVNFRAGRYSECKACESKKQIYRRNLRLRAESSKASKSSKGKNSNDSSESSECNKISEDKPPILLCSKCFEHSKVCELCTKIQYHVKARALNKIQEYLCLSCGTNVIERFVQGHYSRCRGCKNDFQVQKYKEAKLRSKELKQQLLSPAELEKLRVAKTIPSRVDVLESQVQALLCETTFLKSELEDAKLENLSLKESFEDTMGDLKKQIKELKFILRN